MARSMLSRGIDTARALSIAYRSLRLVSGSPPPARAAMMMYRLSLLNSLARAASCLPLRTAMFAEWECPAMSPPRPGGGSTRRVSVQFTGGRGEWESPRPAGPGLWEHYSTVFNFFSTSALRGSDFRRPPVS